MNVKAKIVVKYPNGRTSRADIADTGALLAEAVMISAAEIGLDQTLACVTEIISAMKEQKKDMESAA